MLKTVNEKAGDPEENLIYVIVDALSAGCTVGEIAGMMRMAYDYPYDPHGLVEPLV